MKGSDGLKIKDVRGKLPEHPTKSYRERPISAIYYIAVHHSLTDDLPGGKDVEAFARYHVNDLGWPGIGYHYIVDGDGTVYKCHSADVKTYHVGKHNRASLGICLVGDFRDYEPSEVQYKAAVELINQCVEAYGVTNKNILGHSEFSGYEWKKCPAIDMDQLRKEV